MHLSAVLTQLSAMRKLSLSFPTLVTSCPILPEWQSRVKKASVKPYLLEVEHVGVVVVLHGDGGVVAGVLHVGDGGEEEALARRESGCNCDPAPAENRSTRRRSCSGARHQLGLSFIPRSGPLSAQTQNENWNPWSATHLVNWCQRVFSHLSLNPIFSLYFGHNADHLPCSTPRDEEGLQLCTFHSSREKYGHYKDDNYHLVPWWEENPIMHSWEQSLLLSCTHRGSHCVFPSNHHQATHNCNKTFGEKLANICSMHFWPLMRRVRRSAKNKANPDWWRVPDAYPSPYYLRWSCSGGKIATKQIDILSFLKQVWPGFPYSCEVYLCWSHWPH